MTAPTKTKVPVCSEKNCTSCPNWGEVGGKGWLAIAKLKPLSLFISLLSMPKRVFDNVEIDK